jgi:hypothetical protein
VPDPTNTAIPIHSLSVCSSFAEKSFAFLILHLLPNSHEVEALTEGDFLLQKQFDFLLFANKGSPLFICICIFSLSQLKAGTFPIFEAQKCLPETSSVVSLSR